MDIHTTIIMNTISFFLPYSPIEIKNKLIEIGCTNNHLSKNIYKYYHLINYLFLQKVIYKKGYSNLDSQLMRKDYGGGYKKIINNLKNIQLIYLYSNYSTKINKSNGYSLVNGFTFKKYEIDIKGSYLTKLLDNKSINLNSEIKIRIFNSINKINYDLINKDLLNDNELVQIDKIINEPFQVEGIKGKRLYNNFTNLSKTIRKDLRLNGEGLVFVDIVNSQPVFLSMVLKKYCEENNIKIEDSSLEFFNLCFCGSLYEKLMILTGEGREKVKNMVMILLFGKSEFKNNIHDIFTANFPQVINIIEKLKRGDYRKLSHLLQQKESDLIFNCVNNIPSSIDVLTVHDSIYTNKSNLGIIKNELIFTFKRFGINATINVNNEYKLNTMNNEEKEEFENNELNLLPIEIDNTPESELDKKIIDQYNLDVNKFINDFTNTSDLGIKYCIIKKYETYFKKQDAMFDSRFKKMYKKYYSNYSFENLFKKITQELNFSQVS